METLPKYGARVSRYGSLVREFYSFTVHGEGKHLLTSVSLCILGLVSIREYDELCHVTRDVRVG